MTIWLFTCRHTHEDRLVQELARLGYADAHAHATVAGLVLANGLPAASEATLREMDPVWALQVLPDVRRVEAKSIKATAVEVASCLAGPIDQIDGAWLLHILAPGQLRGQPRPKLAGRAELLFTAIGKELQRTRRRAWRRVNPQTETTPQLVAQVLLIDVNHAWLSIAAPLQLATGTCWPSPIAAGLAPVADDPAAPSSAFRKLEEALACMGETPKSGQLAVDLGACPGGWTRVMSRYGAEVVAIDRSPLADSLMKADGIHWLGTDAFTYRPDAPVDWLVSDVIAFPERVTELLNVWCGERLARRVVVQMKFRGPTDWSALEQAFAAARGAGFCVRAKHFFNDKNEVTIMARAPAAVRDTAARETAARDTAARDTDARETDAS